jgi:hypothetical protein
VRDEVGEGVRTGVGGRDFRSEDFRGVVLFGVARTRDSRREISARRFDCDCCMFEIFPSMTREDDWIMLSGFVAGETCCGVRNALS